jgi:hypothetical protein
MSKIKEALKKLLPEDQISEVTGAVDEMIKEAKAELEKEFNEKLEEAYAQLSGELKDAEKTAEGGYKEAHDIIMDLRERLEKQGSEYEKQLEEGYEEAYQHITVEREKNKTLEAELYEEYDKKLGEMKNYVVDKLDEFLQSKGSEIYEQARRDVINDPRMAEHKVALDKIVDITANYLSDEDYTLATSTKLDESRKHVDEMKGQLRLMEARNMRLSTENTKLNEQVRHSSEKLLTEQKVAEEKKKTEVKNEQKERAEKAKNVTGRGHIKTDEVIITEHNNQSGEFDELLVLAGLKKE